MTIPKCVKKWCTRGTGYAGEDNWFETRTKAREHARKVLLSGKKSVVRIGKMTEERFRDKKCMHRDQFVNVESWIRGKAGIKKVTL